MNGVVLLAACVWKKIGIKKKLLRLAITASGGSVCEVVLLLSLKNYILFILGSGIIVIPLMVLAVFGYQSGHIFRDNLAVCYGMTFLIGGVLQVAENYFHIGSYPVWMAMTGLCAAVSVIGLVKKEKERQSHLCLVQLQQGKREWNCTGLLDSGNRLKEPLTGKPIHIVGEEILKELGIQKDENSGVVSFQSLGNEEGYALTYRIQKLCIGKERNCFEEERAILALDEKGIFKEKNYQMILNASCLEQIPERS